MPFCCFPSLSEKPEPNHGRPTSVPGQAPPGYPGNPASQSPYVGGQPAHPSIQNSYPVAQHPYPGTASSYNTAYVARPPVYYGTPANYPPQYWTNNVMQHHLPSTQPVAPGLLSPAQLEFFAEHGYIHLRNVISQQKVQEALAVIDAAYAARDYDLNDANPTDVVPRFRDNVAKNKIILRILNDPPLFKMVEQLIGVDKCWGVQRVQVALREPSAYLASQGMNLYSPPPPELWHIDGGPGKYAKVGSPFTMLVGVALSDGQQWDANHGQLLLWPGSHRVLHPLVAERVRKNLITDPYSIFQKERPNLGNPIRVLMHSGDVVLAHQRLAHSGGPNLGSYVRKNLYFRILNKRHDHYLASGELLNGSVFTEYEGIQDIAAKYG